MKGLFLSLLPSLSLIGYDVTDEVNAHKPASQDITGVYHVELLDVSGSMSRDIKGMFQNVIEEIRAYPAGDVVSVFIFSSPGDNRCIVHEVPLDSPEAYESVEATLYQHAHTLGSTEFSGVITQAVNYIEARAAKYWAFPVSVRFYTDGQPCVYNIQGEIRKTLDALNIMQASIREALFVAYGNYPDVPLMSRMAAAVGGTLARAVDLQQFRTIRQDFLADSSSNESRLSFRVPADSTDIVFSINGDTIVQYSPAADGTIFFTPNAKTKRQRVYVLTNRPIHEGLTALTQLTEAQVRGESSSREYMVKGVYASGILLNQQGRTSDATEVFSKYLGDVETVNRLLNAWAAREHADVEASIRHFMSRPKSRLQKGYVLNCLGAESTYTVLDALKTAEEDPNCLFYPHLKNKDGTNRMKYHSISRKKTFEDESLKDRFEFNPNYGAPIRLEFTDKRANVGTNNWYDGTLKLKDEPTSILSGIKWPTGQSRTYNFIVDGIANIDSVPMSMSETAYMEFCTYGLLDIDPESPDYCGSVWEAGRIYTVNLRAVPTIDRARAKAATDPKALCTMLFNETKLFAEWRVAKYFLDKVETRAARESKAWGEALSDENIEFLKSNGLHPERGFQPKMKNCPSVDSYESKEFYVLIAGLSNWSPVEEILEKVKLGKKLTFNESLQNDAIEAYWKNISKEDGDIQVIKLNKWKTQADVARTKLQRQIRERIIALVGTNRRLDDMGQGDVKEYIFDMPSYPKLKFTVTYKKQTIVI